MKTLSQAQIILCMSISLRLTLLLVRCQCKWALSFCKTARSSFTFQGAFHKMLAYLLLEQQISLFLCCGVLTSKVHHIRWGQRGKLSQIIMTMIQKSLFYMSSFSNWKSLYNWHQHFQTGSIYQLLLFKFMALCVCVSVCVCLVDFYFVCGYFQITLMIILVQILQTICPQIVFLLLVIKPHGIQSTYGAYLQTMTFENISYMLVTVTVLPYLSSYHPLASYSFILQSHDDAWQDSILHRGGTSSCTQLDIFTIDRPILSSSFIILEKIGPFVAVLEKRQKLI